ncbi:hypothetical protein [Saccharomonospora piscinae]|uniref:hypothetical protein n=1 Tax=Saccharomonospora piscinae TaxID=687388 RepID=UPI0004631EE0|nr:hypothetical protein [Saccharomonospora piscinae]
MAARLRVAVLAGLVCAFVAALLGGSAGQAHAQPPLPLPPVDTPGPEIPLPPVSTPAPTPAPSSPVQPPPIVVDPDHPVAPAPPPQRPGPQPGSGSEDCGWLDIVCQAGQAINEWFTDLVTSAMDPVLDLVGRTSMTTPDVAGNPQISQLWDITRWVANSLFILFVIVGGIVVASHESLQTRVTLKETLPRLVVGFVAVNASLSLIGLAITFVNGIATGILAGDSSGGITTGVKDEIHRQLEQGGIFMVLVALVVLVLAVVLLALYVLRLTVTVIVVVAGPLALVCHASPYTEGIAKLWWRVLVGVLTIQILQAITLVVFVKVFFVQGTSDAATTDLLGVSGGLMNLVISVVLLFILIKIPGWVLQQVGLGGRSAVASIVKYAMIAKGLGMLGIGSSTSAGAGAAARGAGRRGRGRPRRGSPSGGSADPYARVRTGPGGQYVLPLSGLKRGRLAPPPRAQTPGQARGPPGDAAGAAVGSGLAGEQARARPRRSVPAAAGSRACQAHPSTGRRATPRGRAGSAAPAAARSRPLPGQPAAALRAIPPPPRRCAPRPAGHTHRHTTSAQASHARRPAATSSPGSLPREPAVALRAVPPAAGGCAPCAAG